MIRQLHRVLRSALPEPVKAPLRRLLNLWRNRGSRPQPALIREDGHLLAKLPGPLLLRLTDDSKGSLAYQFQTDRSSAIEMAEFLAHARQRRTLVDAGAHHALFSALFCLSHPDNRALAFEPSPIALAIATRNLELNGLRDRACLRPVALGSSHDESVAVLDPVGFVRLAGGPPAGPRLSLSVRTLDEELDATSLAPDLFKLDVEGFEPEVLDGARNTLRRHHPLIFLELHLDLLERRGIAPQSVLATLKACGYDRFTVNGRMVTPARICGSSEQVIRLLAT